MYERKQRKNRASEHLITNIDCTIENSKKFKTCRFYHLQVVDAIELLLGLFRIIIIFIMYYFD